MKGMKIDHEALRKLYDAYLSDNTAQSRKDCPSPDAISSIFQSSTSESKRNEILAHVLDCSHCAKDFQLILSVLREKREFINNIKDILKSTEKSRKEEDGFKSLFYRFSWKYAFILLSVLICVVVLILNIPNKITFRGTNNEAIELISPLDVYHSKSSLLFAWEMVENADYFILEIFNDSLYPVWESEKTTVNQMYLPSDVQAKFISNKTYYWLVTAYFPNDRILESHLQKFVLSR